MKVLLVSDNHGDAAILERIANEFSDHVDLMMHCGDSNLESTNPVMANFQTVIGNTDWNLDYPEIQVAEVAQQRVVVTHGHLYQVNFTMTPLTLLAKEQNADIMAFGHTHQLGAVVEDGTLYINPGSISQPRGKYQKLGGTFAIVETTPEAFLVQYYDRNLLPVDELNFKLMRK